MSEESKEVPILQNVHQRINAIKTEIDYIRKDKKVEGYMAVTHDMVTAMTRELFIKHGVLIVPDEISSEVVETGTMTGKGKPWIRFEAKYNIGFMSIDEPSQVIAITLTAHAEDYGDKAPGKCLSYAVKYAILKLLQIETGENEEGRDTEARTTVTQEQAQAFFKFIEDKDALGTYLFTQRVGVEVYANLMGKLSRTFPKGQKMKMKEAHNEFVANGQEIWGEIVKALNENDAGLLAESVEDVSEITNQLIQWKLSENQADTFRELMDANNGV